MTEPDLDTPLTRTAASKAVEAIGWRYLVGTLSISIPVRSLAQATEVAAAAAAASGEDADDHLRLDLRADRLWMSVQTRALGAVTARDTRLARRISHAISVLGLQPAQPSSIDRPRPAEPPSTEFPRPLQLLPRPVPVLDLAIDALDIQAIRPFWKAVLAYVDKPGQDSLGLIDPAGQLPTLWFQQMDAPRPQRNRIHFDIAVAHDEAEARIHAALTAGGRLLSDRHARSFWILADAEGNEICVCTWQDRDKPVRD